MKRIFVIMAALILLLTACGADIPAASEHLSGTTAQTPAPETAIPSEMPGSGSNTPAEPSEPESMDPTEKLTPESSAPAETTMPADATSTEAVPPASPAPETAPPAESAVLAQTPEPTKLIEEQESSTMTITINGRSFFATLYDNETAAALKANLPLTLTMSELNGNEKYNYLPYSLPANASNPGQIHAGDLMLYGSDCLVLFYESFPTSYRYTPIGRINDPTGLADAVGGGSVQITFAEE